MVRRGCVMPSGRVCFTPLPLLHAAKDLDEGSYASWAHRYKAACASSTNRASKVGAVCEELEAGLTLLGATAVEDKLQVCL